MKVLVVADRALIREALRGVLKELRGDITVLEAVDSRQAMEIVAEHADLDLILLDLNLLDRDGFSVLSELRESHLAISVVVMSAQKDHRSVVKALNQGARGFIPKSATREVMLSALQLVFAGGIYVPPEAIAQAKRPVPPRQPQFDALTSVLTGEELEQLDDLMLALADLDEAAKGEGTNDLAHAIARVLVVYREMVKDGWGRQ